MTTTLDINKTKEFIIFLLNQIADYKKDGHISNNELQQFKNRLDNFKEQINSYLLIPMNIKERILTLYLNVNLKLSISKEYFRYIFNYERTDYSKSQM